MKSSAFLHLVTALALLAPAVSGLAQTRPATSNSPITSGETRVIVPTTVSELAAGYAEAVNQMALKSIVVYVKGDGKTIAIKGLRSARAAGSVLLITLSSGSMIAVNPLDILLITDGPTAP